MSIITSEYSIETPHADNRYLLHLEQVGGTSLQISLKQISELVENAALRGATVTLSYEVKYGRHFPQIEIHE